jgi:hypothetical protein
MQPTNVEVTLDTLVVEATLNTVVVEATLSGPTGPTGPSGTGDKTFSMVFTSLSTVLVQHNLQKYPSVTVVDSAYSEVIGDVVYIDTNSLSVSFTGSFSGDIFCN